MSKKTGFKKRVNVQKAGAGILVCLFLGACGISLIPSKDEWYMQHFIIMQDFERTAYKNLSEQGRQEFQKLFWEARQPASKQIFLKRLEITLKSFKKENSHQPWNCDRARIYLLNGSPASVEYAQNDNWMMSMTSNRQNSGISERDKENIEARTAEIWTYPYKQFLIKYAFAFSAPKKWRLVTGAFSGNRYLGAFELQSRSSTYGIIDIKQYKEKIDRLEKKK